jgi:hypothetical protein
MLQYSDIARQFEKQSALPFGLSSSTTSDPQKDFFGQNSEKGSFEKIS